MRLLHELRFGIYVVSHGLLSFVHLLGLYSNFLLDQFDVSLGVVVDDLHDICRPRRR